MLKKIKCHVMSFVAEGNFILIFQQDFLWRKSNICFFSKILMSNGKASWVAYFISNEVGEWNRLFEHRNVYFLQKYIDLRSLFVSFLKDFFFILMLVRRFLWYIVLSRAYDGWNKRYTKCTHASKKVLHSS